MYFKVSTFIVAEVGVNHNGCLKTAKELIDTASSCGADAVKFQSYVTEDLVAKFAEKANYQKLNSNSKESQFEMLKRYELSEEDHYRLFDYCNKKDIIFMSSPFDLKSLDMLINLGVDIIKIPSGEITNYPLLREIGKSNKQTILSTGMSTIEEIKCAINLLTQNGTEIGNISILHANTMYPTPFNDVNLNVLKSIKKKFNTKVGYSDHTQGIEVSIAAVALGAEIIEKHITLDRKFKGPDHSSSLDPAGFCDLVKSIRHIESAFGSSQKQVSDSERENIRIARKSVFSKRKILKGEVFSEANLTTKRPGGGISPMHWEKIIGKRATKFYNTDEMIEEDL